MNSLKFDFFVLVNIIWLNIIWSMPLPLNQYSFMLARNYIKSTEIFCRNTDKLSKKEKVLNLYFEKLKYDEFNEINDKFYPSLPVEDYLAEIQRRPLYLKLKSLPKGGNLHVHEYQMLNRKTFLELIQDLPDYEYLYICLKSECTLGKAKCNCKINTFKFFKKNVEAGFVKVKDSGLSIEELVRQTTLIGVLNSQNPKIFPTNNKARWNLSLESNIFESYDDLFQYNVTRFIYLKAVLDGALDENYQLIEFRRPNFGDSFYFDSNNERVHIDQIEEINYILKFKTQYLKDNPKFIDFSYIIYSSKNSHKNKTLNNLIKSIDIQKKYPDLIRGFDLVGPEDTGYSLLFHSDSLYKGFNHTLNTNNEFNYFFHVGETNMPEDALKYFDDDSVTSSNNIYEAIIFKSNRIGHGLSLFKHPELYSYVKDRNIAIEVCPTSNQILGFTPDLRNHPGINFYRNGVPIVLASDDPGTFGYNELTIDYYNAFLAWGLNLYDLKVIASNSILYSSIHQTTKAFGLEKFKNVWNSFVNKTYYEVCNMTFNSSVKIVNILPTFGPVGESTKITIFGNGFESAICKNISCIFENQSTNAVLSNLNEISCYTPLGFNANDNVKIILKINDDQIDTKFNFTFLSSKLIREDPYFYPKAAQTQNFSTAFNSLINFFNLLMSFFKSQ